VAGVEAGRIVAGDRLALSQNAPNPFGASTRISFLVKGGSDNARLSIYDVRGEVVKTLVSGPVGASETAVTWDGSDSRGAHVAPGIYFARLAADGSSLLKKMVVVE
jgi:flagellar hook assembly protein FlgD